MCLLDFGFTKTLPQFYAYKVREPLSKLVVDDYFYPEDKLVSNDLASMAFPSMSAHSEDRKVEMRDSMPFMEDLVSCKNSESSSSTQYLVAEGNILRNRCQHFCNENRVKSFRRLIKLDAPELYFDNELCIKDLEDPKSTEEQVKKYVKKIDVFAQKRAHFDTNTLAKVKPQKTKELRRNYIEEDVKKPENLAHSTTDKPQKKSLLK